MRVAMFWLTIEEDTREIGSDTGRQAKAVV
jgi:hypothetical protein